MPLQTPTAGELRERVRFERLTASVNVGGVTHGAGWAVLITPRAAKVVPTTGGEAVIADRMSGKTRYDMWVRTEAAVLDLTPQDRAVNDRTGEIYNIAQPIDPNGRRQWLFIQAMAAGRTDQQGVTDGAAADGA